MPQPPVSPDDNGYPPTIPIIAASLIAGVCLFVVVTLAIRVTQGAIFSHAWADFSNPLVVIGLVVGLSCFGASLIVPGILDRQNASSAQLQGDSDQAGVFQTRTIVQLALAEGGAFLNLVVFLVEGHPVSLAASCLLLGWMIALFPTRDRHRVWLESRRGTWR